MAFRGLTELVRAVKAGKRENEDILKQISKQNKKLRRLEKEIKRKRAKRDSSRRSQVTRENKTIPKKKEGEKRKYRSKLISSLFSEESSKKSYE